MNYKLVCIDMDGTLLNSRKEISENTRLTLQRAHALGIKIVIATGRIFSNAAFYSNLVGVQSPVIASNGSFVREKDVDKVIYKCAIDSKKSIEIMNLCKKYKTKVNFYTPYGAFCSSKLFFFIMKNFIQKKVSEPIFVKYFNSERGLCKNILENEGNIIKCEIVHREANIINRLREALAEIEDIEIASSSSRNIEITKKGVSKGKAVEKLAEYYGIKREEIIAIGDSENDISMIEFAGLGVAMGNALDKIKAKADYVTDTNNNEGVAKVIEKYIL